jgi:hypothetical protein
MSLKYHDPTYLKAIKQSSGKAIKEAYTKLGKAFQAEKRDFTMIDAEKDYWEEQLQADKTLTKKQKDNILLHIKNLNEIKDKRTIDIVYESSDGNFKFKKKVKEAEEEQARQQPPAGQQQQPPPPKKKKKKKKRTKKKTPAAPEPAPPAEQPPAVEPEPAKKKGKFQKKENILQGLFDELRGTEGRPAKPDAVKKINEFLDDALADDSLSSKQHMLDVFLTMKGDKNKFQGVSKTAFKKKSRKEQIEFVKQNLNNYIVDIGLPGAAEQVREQRAQEEQARIEAEKLEGATEAEAELMGGTEEEREKAKEAAEKRAYERAATAYLLTHDPANNEVNFDGLDITPEKYKFPEKDISRAIEEIITNDIYISRLNKEITDAQRDEAFKRSTPQQKTDIINKRIKGAHTPEEINRAIQKPELAELIRQIKDEVYDGLDTTAPEEHRKRMDNTMEELVRLYHEVDRYAKNFDVEDIGNILYDYNENIQTEQNQLKTNKIKGVLQAQPDISVLPRGVRTEIVRPETLQTELDRYNERKKELEPLLTKLESTRTPAERNRINVLTTEMKGLEKKAKEQLKKQQDATSKRTTATKRSGILRPHFKNPTKEAVQNAIGETAEQQIQDIQNWYIFDLPEYNTGVGNKLENPLVKQNVEHQKELYKDVNIFTAYDSFLITDGVEERKDFYNQHTDLNKAGIERGLKQVYYDETEEEFLQKFNSGSNGLFSQDQTKAEQNDFQNIYQIPQGHINNQHPPQFTNNRGITENNKEWINNLNIFYKGATIN